MKIKLSSEYLCTGRKLFEERLLQLVCVTLTKHHKKFFVAFGCDISTVEEVITKRPSDGCTNESMINYNVIQKKSPGIPMNKKGLSSRNV